MRTSGKDIYVVAGDNFPLTLTIRDTKGKPISPALDPNKDKIILTIAINSEIISIDGIIEGDSTKFFILSEHTSFNPGTYYYDIKMIRTRDAAANKEITTIVSKSIFEIEESVGDIASIDASTLGKNPQEAEE